ncbi:MAG TPA: tartrate dehydrogenase [Vicinamibacterales bacterium]|nr:tartrate dehydrogenase [Vicinamibacterales bacterium]
MSSRRHRIAVIPGDGIGREVTPAALHVIQAVARHAGVSIDSVEYPWGCDYYRETGRMMAPDALDVLRGADAIYLGAIGHPSVPDHVSVWELILPIRQRFEQYVNLRPMRLLPGVPGPLAGRGPADVDMVCVRENSEGEYAGLGGRLHRGTPHEVAEQTGLFTRRGIERVVRYAFEVAQTRPRRLLASATKSNALQHSMVLWDEVVDELAPAYTDVTVRRYHVDALAARMVTHPDSIDVIVASNLFGDILTDLGAAVSGSLGVAPGANLNPGREYPSMFEPIHGSAPDIAGQGVANPIGAIWAGALMMDHLGHRELHDRIVQGIERVLARGEVRTLDLGGRHGTAEVAEAIAAEAGAT